VRCEGGRRDVGTAGGRSMRIIVSHASARGLCRAPNVGTTSRRDSVSEEHYESLDSILPATRTLRLGAADL